MIKRIRKMEPSSVHGEEVVLKELQAATREKASFKFWENFDPTMFKKWVASLPNPEWPEITEMTEAYSKAAITDKIKHQLMTVAGWKMSKDPDFRAKVPMDPNEPHGE